jgi:hypothetical protein
MTRQAEIAEQARSAKVWSEKLPALALPVLLASLDEALAGRDKDAVVSAAIKLADSLWRAGERTSRHQSSVVRTMTRGIRQIPNCLVCRLCSAPKPIRAEGA